MQRRDRGKVTRGDDRSYSPPPPDELSYHNRRQQHVKRVRPGTNEEGEPPYVWAEDRRGVAEARRCHGSSEDGSRSLTPAMTDEEVDDDWLLAEEEEQMITMMERKKGPSRSEWSGGGNGRSRSDAGDRERRRYEVSVLTMLQLPGTTQWQYMLVQQMAPNLPAQTADSKPHRYDRDTKF